MFKKKNKYLFGAISILLFFSTGNISKKLLQLVESPWERIDFNSSPKADAIVVLGAGGMHLPPGKTKFIEWSDPDRFQGGVNLYKLGKANKLLFTGGYNPYYPEIPEEGKVYIKEVKKFGLDNKNIYTTRKVFNTYEEAKAIKNLLLEISPSSKKIILVTSAFHMKRAKKIFERQGMIVNPFPVDFKSDNYRNSSFNPYYWVPNSKSLNESSIAIREIIGRFVYRSW